MHPTKKENNPERQALEDFDARLSIVVVDFPFALEDWEPQEQQIAF